MSIQFQGLEELDAKLEQLVSPEKIRAAMGRACMLIEREAKIKAPKGNGELARSIESRIEGTGADIQGIVFTPLEYAPYVEYGTGLFAEEGGRTDVPWRYQDDEGEWHTTSGMYPQPYMRPALDENREEVKRILMEGLMND